MTDQTILSQLRDHLREEQDITTIEDLDKNLITQAQDRVRKIENCIRSGDGDREQLAEEGEAILETLSDLHQLRGEKLVTLAKYPDILTPVNRLLRTDRR